jgi:predicted Rossmann fold flavoprotein
MSANNLLTDVIIIGAGASGLMCASTSGRRGRKVLVIDHAAHPGQKLLMSGGGHCNFTNRHISAENYISHNPHFCKSALSRYTQWDFLALVHKYHIAFSEREHGRFFCDGSSRDILNMLLSECGQSGVSFQMDSEIEKISVPKPHPLVPKPQLGNGDGYRFKIHTDTGNWLCRSIVVATGGLSVPAAGASPLGYEIARQFNIEVWQREAGLVPFTLQPEDKEKLSALSGIAVDAVVSNKRQSFRENILFTHRGLSGPAILQMSLYWQPGEEITVNLLPETDLFSVLKAEQQRHPQRKLKSVLAEYLPKRLVTILMNDAAECPLQTISHSRFKEISAALRQWTLKPAGTEGYRTAEVTKGGVDCESISSKTMEARETPGLFFIGEVLDVSGHLGGYNLQWAWSSGWCAGQYV